MTARDRLNQLLAPLSRFNLKLDANDSCQIQCANGLVCVVELLPETERAFGYIPVSRLPGGDAPRAALMQEALALNLSFQRGDQFSVVYDKRIDNVVLCSQCPLMTITANGFDQWLSNLIRMGDQVQVRLMQTGLQASLASEQQPAPEQALQQFRI